MKLALPIWNGRVAPLFDIACRVRLVECDMARVHWQAEIALPAGLPLSKVRCLVDHGVEIVICGAITHATEAMASVYGVRVIAFVAGDADEVVDAWLHGELLRRKFRMPGCRHRHCRQRRVQPHPQEER